MCDRAGLVSTWPANSKLGCLHREVFWWREGRRSTTSRPWWPSPRGGWWRPAGLAWWTGFDSLKQLSHDIDTVNIFPIIMIFGSNIHHSLSIMLWSRTWMFIKLSLTFHANTRTIHSPSLPSVLFTRSTIFLNWLLPTYFPSYYFSSSSFTSLTYSPYLIEPGTSRQDLTNMRYFISQKTSFQCKQIASLIRSREALRTNKNGRIAHAQHFVTFWAAAWLKNADYSIPL